MHAVTVPGEKDVKELGIIAPHEHIFIDVWGPITRKGMPASRNEVTKK